jgi:hypothetical protein
MSRSEWLERIEAGLRPSRRTDGAADYDLHLGNDSEWLVSRAGAIETLRDAQTRRVIVANLTKASLQVIRRADVGALSPFDQCLDDALLEDGATLLQGFRTTRLARGAPFFGALSLSAKPNPIGVRLPGSHAPEPPVTIKIDTVTHSDGPYVTSEQLDTEDRRLVDLWQESRRRAQPDGWTEQRENFSLLSLGYARLAEKLVLRYLAAQGKAPEDVSLQQVDGTSDLWASCDILTDQPIDVKNATLFGSRKRHIYVPKFKKMGGTPVQIAGVLSRPSTEYIAGRRRKRHYETGKLVHSVQQTLLGFTALPDLLRVRDAVNALPDRGQPLDLLFAENMLPPWSFEASTDIDPVRLWRAAVIFAHEPTSIIATALACGAPVDERLLASLNPGQRIVFDRFEEVVAKGGYRKASIALFAISELISWALAGRDASSAIRFLRRINRIEDFRKSHRIPAIFGEPEPARSHGYEVEIAFAGSACGGLYDPTDSIATLLMLLERCAAEIQRLPSPIRHFDVPNPYILIGRDDRGQAITLYAYCGGKLPHGAWCNHFPLMIGDNAPCPSCRRLVCHECDYCSEPCPDRRKRKAARDAEKAAARNPFGP